MLFDVREYIDENKYLKYIDIIDMRDIKLENELNILNIIKNISTNILYITPIYKLLKERAIQNYNRYVSQIVLLFKDFLNIKTKINSKYKDMNFNEEEQFCFIINNYFLNNTNKQNKFMFNHNEFIKGLKEHHIINIFNNQKYNDIYFSSNLNTQINTFKDTTNMYIAIAIILINIHQNESLLLDSLLFDDAVYISDKIRLLITYSYNNIRFSKKTLWKPSEEIVNRFIFIQLNQHNRIKIDWNTLFNI